MQEDKREKVRLPSDSFFRDHLRFTRFMVDGKAVPLPAAAVQAAELETAHERARLTVLNLTHRDKRFLRAMKIEC